MRSCTASSLCWTPSATQKFKKKSKNCQKKISKFHGSRASMNSGFSFGFKSVEAQESCSHSISISHFENISNTTVTHVSSVSH